MRLPDGRHLTYCTNVHPAETAEGVRAALAGPVRRVKARVCPEAPMGVGLRLSDAAARDPGALRGALDAEGLYAFTVNGFVHGGFQVDGLKERVYAPAWTDPERVAYTLRCAEVLVDLLPEGLAGSLSTLAGTYRPWGDAPAVRAACAEGYVVAVEGLRALRDRTGRTVRLAVEPEPWTTLETTVDVVAFWEEHLRPTARGRVSEGDLGELIGVCYDACHLAVMYEEPEESVRRLISAGIPIHKVQVTNAAQVRPGGAGASALLDWAEPRFLHQTVGRRPDGGLVRARDLPEVGGADWAACDTWRSHFHVAVYAEELEGVGTTRGFLEAALGALNASGGCDHFEVETYTWEVTSEAARAEASGDDLVAMLAQEMRWTAERLEGR